MLAIIFFSLCFFISINAEPWLDNKIYNENDLEYHCYQICGSKQDSVYNSTSLTCYCYVNKSKKLGIDWKVMKKYSNVLGLSLKVLDNDTKKIAKREIGKLKLRGLQIKDNKDDGKKEKPETPKIEPSTTEPVVGAPLGHIRIRPLRPRLRPRPLPRPRPILPGTRPRLGGPKKTDNDEESRTEITALAKLRERLDKIKSDGEKPKNPNGVIVQPKETLRKH